MADAPGAALLDRLCPHPDVIVGGAALLSVEFLAVVVYLLVVPTASVAGWVYYAVPFVWIDAALWALWRVDVPAASARRRLLAGSLAAGYFGVVAYAGGLVGPGLGTAATGLRVSITGVPPGWSPAVLYGGERVTLALLPFEAVGYLALAYLVYASVLDAARSAAAGVVGLFSCVSCTLPVLAGFASGIAGGGGALVSAALSQSYALSSAVFVLTVVLLAWRPAPRTFLRWRSLFRI